MPVELTPSASHLCPQCGQSLPASHGLCLSCLAQQALSTNGQDELSMQGEEVLQIEGWRIIGTLGAGGMGRVYQAENLENGESAAIKVLDARWMSHPAMVARFVAEAVRHAQLKHPHILQHLGTAETEDGRLCLITEIVHGCDLARLLRTERLPLERAVDIFLKTCAAVQHAHEAGLLHRDIKPSNILIGQEQAVKLADFGLATEWSEDDAAVSRIGALTLTTDHLGSAYYMAPERLLKPPSGADPRADVYALGVLLYHLTTGQMPLGNYRPVSELTELPVQMDGIMAQALAADPKDRTPSVDELSAAVSGVWQDHQDGTLRHRRKRRWLMLSNALLGAFALLSIGAWWQFWRSRQQSVVFTDPQQASQSQPWVNSLGMKFVPVPGTEVLFSVWEVRRSDFKAYQNAQKDFMDDSWLRDLAQMQRDAVDETMQARQQDGSYINFKSWDEPGFAVTPDHPACFIRPGDVRYFYHWLTWKERHEGRLKPGQYYRVPTEAEWLTAAGGKDAALRPGNLAGPEMQDLPHWSKLNALHSVRDPFPGTAPVASFPEELHGLYDMSGNVAEWVQANDREEQMMDAAQNIKLIGPAWVYGEMVKLRFDHVHRYNRSAGVRPRLPSAGFRLVLVYATEATKP